MPLDADFLTSVTPRYITNKTLGDAQSRIIAGIGPVLQQMLAAHAIDADLRAAHFVAQACHETNGLAQCAEMDSGQAYEGRTDLGNVRPGDGPRYKGRGIFQLTGRANYASYGTKLGIDLIGNPDLAADPVTALRIACAFWNENGLSKYADADDVLAVSKVINTGQNGPTMPNGLESRETYLAKVKSALGIAAAPHAADASAVLRPGDAGPQVGLLQQKLAAAGYAVSFDGRFGPQTEAAVRKFQTDHAMVADAVVGPQTWSALK